MSDYPEWQAGIRKLQAEHRDRMLTKAKADAWSRARKLHDILSNAGLDVPTPGYTVWQFDRRWINGAPRIGFWLEYQGYHFSMASTVKEIVTVAKGDVVVAIQPFKDSDVYAVADAIDKLEALIAQGVEVGAAG